MFQNCSFAGERLVSNIVLYRKIRRPAFLGEMVDFCIAGGPKMISEGDAPCSNTARRGN